MKKKTKGDVIVNVVIILIGVEPPLISTQALKNQAYLHPNQNNARVLYKS